MSLIDLVFRVDAICKKYEKYDIEKQRELNTYGNDDFARFYAAVDAQIEAARIKSHMASKEKNRASAVALNAEVRRAKTELMDHVPKLRKLVKKKVKGLTSEDMVTRHDLVEVLPERIEAIPDGASTSAKHTGGSATAPPNKHIVFDSSNDGGGNFDSAFYQQSEESSQFRQEYETRKQKQDEGLDFISEGLDTLKNLARDMNEELDRQVPLMDEIDTKVDQATSDLKNNNVRLKKTLTQMRSSQNFCIDIILLCVLLGIICYISSSTNTVTNI